MKHVVLTLLLAGAAIAQYQAPQDTTTTISLSLGREFGIYAVEFGGALALPGCPSGCATMVMYIPTVLDVASYLSDPRRANETKAVVGGIVSLAVWPAMSAAGCYFVGSNREPGGSYLGTLAGAVTGSAAAFGAWYVWQGMRDGPDADYVKWVTVPAVLVGSAAGAVYGYNISMWQNTDRQFSATRFLPPYGTAHAETLDEGVRTTTVSLNLLSLRI